MGADTATEAALVTNIAQQATKQMKMHLNWAYERIGEQRMELNRQFIRKPVDVEKIGVDSAAEFETILPELLQVDARFDITPMNESLMRAEERAEANSRFQIVMQAAPVLAALQVNVNAAEEYKRLLKAYGEDDPDRFFSSTPAQQMPGQSAQQGAPEQPGGGVTAPQSIDPAVSPSVGASMSGATPMARQLSMGGGVSNT